MLVCTMRSVQNDPYIYNIYILYIWIYMDHFVILCVCICSGNSSPPWTRWPLFWQTTFSNAFSWMRKHEFRLKFHWSLFLRVQLTKFQQWFRLWLGADRATSHYLKQCWPSSPTHICVTRGRWVNLPLDACQRTLIDKHLVLVRCFVPSADKP